MLSENPAQYEKHHWIPDFLFGAVLAVLPFVVYMHLVEYDPADRELYGKHGMGNYFTYYRSVWLYILTGSAMLWHLVNRKSIVSWYHQPLVVYAFFIVVSTVFAKYKSTAFFGNNERFEGMLSQLCYLALVFLGINLIKCKATLKKLLIALLISAGILSVIGTLQFFGYDYFYGTFSEEYLTPAYATFLTTGIRQPHDNSIILTFGNSNFTGSYMCMLFVISLAMLLGLKSRWRTGLVPLNILINFNLLGCKSRAALLSTVIISIFILILLRHRLRSNLRIFALLVAAWLITPFVFDAYTLRYNKPRFLDTSFFREVTLTKPAFGRFDSLELAQNQANVVFDGIKLRIEQSNDEIKFYDEFSKEPVPYRLVPASSAIASAAVLTTSGSFGTDLPEYSTSVKDIRISITTDNALQADEVSKNSKKQQTENNSRITHFRVVFPPDRLRGFQVFTWLDASVLQLSRGGNKLHISHTSRGFKILDHLGRPSEIKPVETFGFEGREGFGSYRGYIWSRSLPLLKRTILAGYGPDTFALHFPNHDYIGKLRHVDPGIPLIIDKPHNMYLQIAINTGFISLITALLLFGVYLYESAKLYVFMPPENFTQVAGLSFSMAILAYLITGFFNDSVVSVAPTFWCLLGMGIATNRINQAQNQAL